MKKNFVLKKADCVEYLKKFPSKYVDFAFFDPPYNVGKDYEIYKDRLPHAEYIKRMATVIQEIRRIAKNGFAVYVPYIHLFEFCKLIPEGELIVIKMQSSAYIRTKNIYRKSKNNLTQHVHYLIVTRPAINLCKNLWEDIAVPDDGFLFKDKRYGEPRHPAPTAMKIAERVIEHFTNEGEIVLDPFVGTGTTLVACKKFGRKGIGIDLNIRYLKITRQRLDEEELQTTVKPIPQTA